MKTKKTFPVIFATALFITVFSVQAAFAQKEQWIQQGSPTYLNMHSVAVNLFDSLTIMYADTSRILFTNDGGTNWATAVTLDSVTPILDLVFDPSDTGTVYAIQDSGGGVYKITGPAPGWTATRINSGLVDSSISDIELNPLFPDTLFVVSDSGFHRSFNAGTTWYPTNYGIGQDSLDLEYIAVTDLDRDLIYVTSSNGKVFWSENMGNSWFYRGQITGNITDIKVSSYSKQVVYITTSDYGFYKSTDGGASWSQVNTGITNLDLTSIAVDTSREQRLYVGSNGRTVYRMAEKGSAWTAQSNGLANGSIVDLDVLKSNPRYIFGVTKTQGIYRFRGNASPVLTPTADMNVAVDSSISFTVSATDADDIDQQYLHFYIDSLPSGATFDSLGVQRFSWTPSVSDTGDHSLYIRVNDEYNGFDYDTVLVNVNREPDIQAIADISTPEDSLITFTVVPSDADGDSITVTTSTLLPGGQTVSLPTGASFNSTYQFSWTPDYTQGGSPAKQYVVTFTVTDSRGGSSTESLTISVANVNRAPTFTSSVDDKSLGEGQRVQFLVEGSDPDGDQVSYGASGLPAGASFDSTETHAFTWIPTFTDADSYTVYFYVRDAYAAADTDTVNIIVYNVNQHPQLDSISTPKYVNIGQTVAFTVSATDPDDSDNGNLVYGVSGLPVGASFSTAGVFTWQPSALDYGAYNLTFNVSDPSGVSDYQNVTIIVNRAPKISGSAAVTINENDSSSYTYTVSDADGDSLSITAANLPEGMVSANPTDSTLTLGWKPSYFQSGSYVVKIKADDQRTGLDSLLVQFTVNNVNRAPVITSTLQSTYSVHYGEAISFEIVASDSDMNSITYSAVNVPDGASFNAETHIFSWTPSSSYIGQSNTVTFWVKDSYGDSVSTFTTILVTGENRAPYFSPVIADYDTVKEGSLVSFAVQAIDSEGDLIFYSADSLPTGADFDGMNTHQFSWIPTYGQAGSYAAIFKISDPDGAFTRDTVNFTVSNVNRAPALTALADTIFVTDSVRITITATDPDGDQVSFGAVGIPQNAQFTSSGNQAQFYWIPESYQFGSKYPVVFSAKDVGTGDTKSDYESTVFVANRHPVLSGTSVYNVTEDSYFSFTITGTDADNDALTFGLDTSEGSSLPSGSSVSYEGNISFSWTPQIGQAGVYTLLFTAVDGHGGTAYKAIQINVAPFDGNYTPDIVSIKDKTIDEGKELVFQVVAIDMNAEDEITYGLVSALPEGAQFDAAESQLFRWTPTYKQSGEYEIVFSATDQKNKQGTETVKITVLNVNQVPVSTIPSDTVFTEGQTVNMLLGITDADNDPVTVSSQNIPAGAQLVQNGRMYNFIWNISYFSAGNYAVVFSISDTSGANYADTLNVTVNNLNRTPTSPVPLYPVKGEPIGAGDYLIWTKTTDPDSDDVITYELQFDNNLDFGSPVLLAHIEKSKSGKSVLLNDGTRKLLKTELPPALKAKAAADGTSDADFVMLGDIPDYTTLPDDEILYWRIRAYDNRGAASAYSTGYKKFVVNLHNSAPDAPNSGFSPAGDMVISDLTPVISWNPAFDPDIPDNSSTLKYIVQLDDNGFASGYDYQLESAAGRNSVELTVDLADDQAWYFRVKTVDQGGAESGWSTVQRFFTNSVNNAPALFSLLIPEENSSIGSVMDSIIFQWESAYDSDPVDTVYYLLQVATDTTFTTDKLVYTSGLISAETTVQCVARSVFQPGTYYWRVKAIDTGNMYTFSREVRSFGLTTGIDEKYLGNTGPKAYRLMQNYPNPFNGGTVIEYSLAKAGRVKIDIYNLVGQHVISLVNNFRSEGAYRISWNGTDKNGLSAASGMYIYKIQSGNFVQSKRMIYLK